MLAGDALDQIAMIRQRIARAEMFGGYRAATTAFSAGLAVVASAATAVIGRRHVVDDTAYLVVWIGAAVLCLLVMGVDVGVRLWRTPSSLQRDLTWSAVEHFVPSVVAGGLLTFVLYRTARETVWILPGLWMVLFGLGIHASRRLLPRFSGTIAGYYLASGLLVIALGRQAAFNPWTMGVVFGVGQSLAAGLLWAMRKDGRRV